ncbi:hypothetical protein ACFYWD_07890 [Streptomyces sp. NPDC003781]|uniref:hypothetical protein n=1 Tax=Streptomyces sp. NPDC003781 TaxID=3364686 RepID=UPI0036AF96CF
MKGSGGGVGMWLRHAGTTSPDGAADERRHTTAPRHSLAVGRAPGSRSDLHGQLPPWKTCAVFDHFPYDSAQDAEAAA